MSKKLYVGNLSFRATEEEVRDLFEPYGDVESISMITDRETGRFRGFCFVEMGSGAEEAIDALDGYEVDGRSLKVNEAKPREERSGGHRGGSRGGGGRREGGGHRDGGGYRGGDSRQRGDNRQRGNNPRGGGSPR